MRKRGSGCRLSPWLGLRKGSWGCARGPPDLPSPTYPPFPPLSTVLAASLSTKTVNFLRSDNGDEALFKALVKEAFEVQVGIHELLGHGSGKLFCQHKDGSFNFERESTLDPLTDRPVASFYKPGESWDSRFPGFGSSYEECRAELVGIFLCVQTRVLSIFGHEGDKAQDILYVNWLNMARAGLLALEFYRPETGSWGQVRGGGRITGVEGIGDWAGAVARSLGNLKKHV